MLIVPGEFPSAGYPTEYLLSRIRSRRFSLLQAGGPESEERRRSGEDDRRIWQGAQAERCWLFAQMNVELRSILAPLFVYFEINTLVQALRNLAAGEPDKIGVVLQQSLLGKGVRDIFRSGKSVSAVLSGFERYCHKHQVDMAGVAAAYAEGGLRRSEEMLRGSLLFRALHDSRHNSVTVFLRDLVGMRNLLVLAMGLRWQAASPLPLLEGGSLDLKRTVQGVSEKDLRRMVRSWTGGDELNAGQLHPAVLEPVLQSSLLQRITRLRRLGDPVVECIEYIWRFFLVTRKRSIRYHGADVGQGAERTGGPR